MRKIANAAVLLLAMLSWSCETRLADMLPDVDFLQSKSAFEKGQEAYAKKDYPAAMAEWRPVAEQGNVRAQFFLGVMYQNGRGVAKSYAEAGKWYGLAAKQNYSRAQFNLGIMYAKGRGVPRDDAKAVELYRKAAEQGYAKAQYNLGIMHLKGQGGRVGSTDTYKWLSLAATRLPEGKYRDTAVRLRDRIGKKMSRARIAEAKRLASAWTAKHGKK